MVLSTPGTIEPIAGADVGAHPAPMSQQGPGAWNGQPNQPPSQPQLTPEQSASRQRAALLILAAIGIAAVGWFYVAVWDTAQGKCRRGDIGACFVWEAQEAQRHR